MRTLKSFGGPAGLVVLACGFGTMLFAPEHRLPAYVLMGVGAVLVAVAAAANLEDLKNAARGRALRHGTNAVFYTLFVLLIVAAVNFLSARHHKRFDVTEEGLNTLAPQTVQILENLKGDVQVVAFYSEMNEQKRRFEDLASEYSYHTDKLRVRVVDPYKSPGEARQLEISQDGTIVVLAPAGEARITSIGEEELTNAILKATRKEKKRICFTTGHGESSIADDQAAGFSQAADALKKENFETEDLLLLQARKVPAECSAVVVAGPATPLLPAEADALDAYLAGGGRLLVMKRDPKAGTGLDRLLAEYGLRVNSDVIVDQLSRAVVGDEFVPVVTTYEPHAATKALSDKRLVTFYPVASSVEKIDAGDPGVQSQVIARTGPDAWGETGDVASFEEGSDNAGPVGLVATASAKVAGTKAAPEEGAEAGSAGAPETGPPGEDTAPQTGEDERRIVLTGDSDFASNAYLHLSGNSDMFLNAVAWLSSESDLISIRPRTHEPQPVTLTASRQNLLSFMTFALPLAAIVAGAGVWIRRKKL